MGFALLKIWWKLILMTSEVMIVSSNSLVLSSDGAVTVKVGKHLRVLKNFLNYVWIQLR